MMQREWVLWDVKRYLLRMGHQDQELGSQGGIEDTNLLGNSATGPTKHTTKKS